MTLAPFNIYGSCNLSWRKITYSIGQELYIYTKIMDVVHMKLSPAFYTFKEDLHERASPASEHVG